MLGITIRNRPLSEFAVCAWQFVNLVMMAYMTSSERCCITAGQMYSNQTVGFLLQKLEMAQEKVRVPTLEVLKHVINSCGTFACAEHTV